LNVRAVWGSMNPDQAVSVLLLANADYIGNLRIVTLGVDVEGYVLAFARSQRVE
jgi:hypothetical protein